MVKKKGKRITPSHEAADVSLSNGKLHAGRPKRPRLGRDGGDGCGQPITGRQRASAVHADDKPLPSTAVTKISAVAATPAVASLAAAFSSSSSSRAKKEGGSLRSRASRATPAVPTGVATSPCKCGKGKTKNPGKRVLQCCVCASFMHKKCYGLTNDDHVAAFVCETCAVQTTVQVDAFPGSLSTPTVAPESHSASIEQDHERILKLLSAKGSEGSRMKNRKYGGCQGALFCVDPACICKAGAKSVAMMIPLPETGAIPAKTAVVEAEGASALAPKRSQSAAIAASALAPKRSQSAAIAAVAAAAALAATATPASPAAVAPGKFAFSEPKLGQLFMRTERMQMRWSYASEEQRLRVEEAGYILLIRGHDPSSAFDWFYRVPFAGKNDPDYCCGEGATLSFSFDMPSGLCPGFYLIEMGQVADQRGGNSTTAAAAAAAAPVDCARSPIFEVLGSPVTDSVFCVCGDIIHRENKKKSRAYIQCTQCMGWLHRMCLRLSDAQFAEPADDFRCPFCWCLEGAPLADNDVISTFIKRWGSADADQATPRTKMGRPRKRKPSETAAAAAAANIIVTSTPPPKQATPAPDHEQPQSSSALDLPPPDSPVAQISQSKRQFTSLHNSRLSLLELFMQMMGARRGQQERVLTGQLCRTPMMISRYVATVVPPGMR